MNKPMNGQQLEQAIHKICRENIPVWYDEAKKDVEGDAGVTVYIQFYRLLVRNGYIDLSAPSTSFREAVDHLMKHPEELQLLVL